MMTTAAARTTSMLASAAILGAMAIAGLTMSISFTPPNVIDLTPPITIEQDTPERPPPLVRPHTPPPPPTAQTEPAETTIPTPPVAQTQPDAIETSWGPPAPPTISNPRWLRQPRNLQIYYPRRALERNVEGQAQLDCLVTTEGALVCQVVSETPSGWGFGQAAVRISQDYRMTPAMREGVPVEARYRMRVPFRVE